VESHLVTQNLVTIPEGSEGASFPRMCEIAYQNVYLASFWVLPTPHSQCPRTDFHPKYVKRRGSAQGYVPFGVRKQRFNTYTP